MKRKRIALIIAAVSVFYMVSYCVLRLSKALVHQEVALINNTDATRDGRAMCYFIHQDIGHGSFVDSDNYNKINSPGVAVRLAKCFYFPLVKLEVSYWRLTRPRDILESRCQH
jgi:hypothetical protein